jgi:hypothetical protein
MLKIILAPIKGLLFLIFLPLAGFVLIPFLLIKTLRKKVLISKKVEPHKECAS